MRLETLQTFDQSDVWTKDKKTKEKIKLKTKRLNDKKSKRLKDRNKNTKTRKRVLYCDVRAVFWRLRNSNAISCFSTFVTLFWI